MIPAVSRLQLRLVVGLVIAAALLGSHCYAFSRGNSRGRVDLRLEQLDTTLEDNRARLAPAIVTAAAAVDSAARARVVSDSLAEVRRIRQAARAPAVVVDSATVEIDGIRIPAPPVVLAELVDLRAQRAADARTIIRQASAIAAVSLERDLWRGRAETAEAKTDLLEEAKRPRFGVKTGAALGAGAVLGLLALFVAATN